MPNPTIGNKTRGTSSPISHDNNGALLIVALWGGQYAGGGGPTGVSVTYNGVALTQICEYSNYWYTSWWVLLTPAAGVHDLAFGNSGGGSITGAYIYSIIDGANSIPVNFAGYDYLSSAPSQSVTSAVNNLVLDIDANGTEEPTPTAGQTTQLSGASWDKGGSLVSVGASTTISYSHASGRGSLSGVEIVYSPSFIPRVMIF